MEEELPARLREGQIGQFVEDDNVLAWEVVDDAALAAGLVLALELVDEIGDIEGAAACPDRMQARAIPGGRAARPRSRG